MELRPLRRPSTMTASSGVRRHSMEPQPIWAVPSRGCSFSARLTPPEGWLCWSWPWGVTTHHERHMVTCVFHDVFDAIPGAIAVARRLQTLLQPLSTHPLCTASLSLWLVVMFWPLGPSVATLSLVFILCEKYVFFWCHCLSRSRSRAATATPTHPSSSCTLWWETFVKAQRL